MAATMKGKILAKLSPVPRLRAWVRHRTAGFPAAREAASWASTWIVRRLVEDVLDDSDVPTTPIVGVLTVVMIGGAEGFNGSDVTTVCVCVPVTPMIGVEVVVTQVWVSPTR